MAVLGGNHNAQDFFIRFFFFKGSHQCNPPIESDHPSSFIKTWDPPDFQQVFCLESSATYQVSNFCGSFFSL